MRLYTVKKGTEGCGIAKILAAAYGFTYPKRKFELASKYRAANPHLRAFSYTNGKSSLGPKEDITWEDAS